MKVILNKKVKYGGVWHPAGIAFEIQDKDKSEMVKLGATIMVTSNMGELPQPGDIFTMSTAELIKFAHKKGIKEDLKGLSKGDILRRLVDLSEVKEEHEEEEETITPLALTEEQKEEKKIELREAIEDKELELAAAETAQDKKKVGTLKGQITKLNKELAALN